MRTAMDIPLMFYIAIRGRRNLPLPGWVAPVVILGVAASVVVKTTYDDQIRRSGMRSATTGSSTSGC